MTSDPTWTGGPISLVPASHFSPRGSDSGPSLVSQPRLCLSRLPLHPPSRLSPTRVPSPHLLPSLCPCLQVPPLYCSSCLLCLARYTAPVFSSAFPEEPSPTSWSLFHCSPTLVYVSIFVGLLTYNNGSFPRSRGRGPCGRYAPVCIPIARTWSALRRQWLGKGLSK